MKKDIPPEELKGLPCRHFALHEGCEIQTDNLKACLEGLIERNIDLSEVTIRSQNLEDLFLKLTGRELRT